MYDNLNKFFREISAIPRGTYNIDNISDYLVDFAKKRGLDVVQDNTKNVLITKKASKGYEHKDTIILQSHMDMVCQKDEKSNHDFLKDGIEIIEDNGFLKANGTTLGADNGIGVALVLSLLDEDILCPKIEALFTVNEEGGMEGAKDFDINLLSGNKLINIDSEQEGVMTVGCAGGVGLKVVYTGDVLEVEDEAITIKLADLLGGHSGVDINKGRINAIKMIGHFLKRFDIDNLIEINGGQIDNAICHDCVVKFISSKIDIDFLRDLLLKYLKDNKEITGKVEISKEIYKGLAFSEKSTKEILRYLDEVSNGVVSFEEDLDNVVRTSLNFGIIKTSKNTICCRHSIRSSSDNEKDMVMDRVLSLANSINASVEIANSYSGWNYNSNSKLAKYMKEIYKELFNKEMIVQVIHAGLECGLFVAKRKDLDCVSIGPTVYGAHTPKERLDIGSANRLYDYLVEILKKM